MKLFITDTSTNLSKTLITQYNIFEIPAKICSLGQIMYHLDTFINKYKDIYYFSSDSNYETIVSMSKKILSLYSDCQITIINVDSGTIGKNNLVLKTVLSLKRCITFDSYHASLKKIQGVSYSMIIKNNINSLLN